MIRMMDSPEPDNRNHDGDADGDDDDDNDNDNDNSLKISVTFSSSSPSVQESPFLSYLRNLSPIKPVKNVQRISQTSCFHVPQPVFTSPRVDLQRVSSFTKRENDADKPGSDGYGRGNVKVYVHNQNSESTTCNQKEDKSCSPSVGIDEYFADPVDMEAIRNSSDPSLHKNQVPKTSSTKEDDNDDTESNSLFGDQQPVPQTADGRSEDNNVGDGCWSFPHPLQIVEEFNKDSAHGSRSGFRGSGKESDQHQRGIRRHLQFEAKMVCNDTGNETDDNANSSMPDSLPNFGSVVPLHAEPDGISTSYQASAHPQTATFLSSYHPSQSVRSAQIFGHDSPAFIPSGLGLPLNAITRSMSMGSDSTSSKKSASHLHDQEEKQMPGRNHSSGKDLDRISLPSVVRETYAHVEDDQQENQASGTVGSAALVINSMPSPSVILPHNTPCEQEIVPYEGRKLASANSDISGELNQESPKHNRKRPKYIADSEGCKRCNCKRSKCLKLYCECFAAGVYCLDTCACENCFNKPEYEDTVLDTRQQIEARNPLAFAPKVVKQATNSPAKVEEGNYTTPSSARHKRGCNCKKSKCLKKYCECYQAEVGCSSGCRCEGCNNSYGKKAVSIYRRAEKWEDPSHEKLDSFEAQDDFIEAGRSHNFTSTWKEIADKTPVLRRHSGLVATSGSLNITDKSNVSEAQAHQGSSRQTSADYFHYHHSPINLAPKLYGSKVVPDLSPNSLLYDLLKEDDTPQTLNASTPTKPVKSGSPNHKRVSPPQDHSQESKSSSSRGLKSGKFVLPDLPSFPPLTPYSKLKDGVQDSGA